ncbi:MAG: phosphoglycerate dehydrogenase [Comamonas sp.]
MSGSSESAAPKVLITQRFIDDETLAFLRQHGLQPVIAELPAGEADGNLSHDTLVQWLQGAAGWIVGHARVTHELLAALPELRVVARRGVGYDRVDTEAVTALGRVATIAAGSNDPTVADLTIGLMLALGRRFSAGMDNVRQGAMGIPMGVDLYRKTVGIVGFGRIGQAVARRLQGFDCRILVHTRKEEHLGAGLEHAELPALLAQSDYVTLHAPLTEQTRHMLRAETLALMKPDAILINTARGGLVDDRDLLAALQAGTIGGAGLDVFMSESDAQHAPVTRALAALPNVVALPHVGASTREGLARTNLVAAKCVVAVLRGTPMPAGCLLADGRPALQAAGPG